MLSAVCSVELLFVLRALRDGKTKQSIGGAVFKEGVCLYWAFDCFLEVSVTAEGKSAEYG